MRKWGKQALRHPRRTLSVAAEELSMFSMIATARVIMYNVS